MKRRIMIIGPNHSGKVQLAQYLDQQVKQRMQACMFYGKNTLTVPGAYLECPWMHQHIIAAQQDANCILMLSAIDRARRHYPPNFAKVFRLPIIGVVTTKTDAVDIAQADVYQELITTGIPQPFFKLNLQQQTDFHELTEIINMKKGGL
ncbi:EutP/PduV family microcompartment system protein [Lacticaseibacillus baoqingensis]|uniref:EutP/PduV family microcompartment system protein n=1 Tax=Lacticaseibacillus baoqingensis TaxID=2486013 RepID=A0ABW4EAB2_9LACO|nr:EutP/PduV family microcompartment system protein [Lacticaseibacillus baoqingensis]